MSEEPKRAEGATSSLVVGFGCERGTAACELIALVEDALRAAGRQPADVALLTSLDTRLEEPAAAAARLHFSVPFQTFDAVTLEAETPRLAHPSEIVFRHTGCHGVAEASALAGAGVGGRLVVAKMKSARATVAIAESFQVIAGISSERESAALCDEPSRVGPGRGRAG